MSSETVLTPGGKFDIWVRVHNDLGCSPVTGAKALVYLADPAALSIQWNSITGGNYVGNNGSSTGVAVAAGGQALIGPLPFTAPTTGIGNGHKCLLAAIQADGEPAAANSSDAPDSNQVAQRNVQFIGPCQYPMTNATTSNGNVQITLTVTPNTGTTPSLTASPDVEVTFDDADSSWFNVWNSQSGKGTTFAVSHSGSSTTVRLGRIQRGDERGPARGRADAQRECEYQSAERRNPHAPDRGSLDGFRRESAGYQRWLVHADGACDQVIGGKKRRRRD